MMYGRRRRTLGALGAAAMLPACVASPSASAEGDTDAAPVGGQGGAGGHGGAPVLDTGLTGGTQPVPDAGPIGGTQPVPDAGPIGGTQPVPDAGPSCAPPVPVNACITARGEPLPFEFDTVLEGEVTAVGTPEADHCDLEIWGQPPGESVTLEVTEASGRILDVKIKAGGLDAYLDAHPLVVGEPVRFDARRDSFESQGDTAGLRWLRGNALAVAVASGGRVTGLNITPLAEVGEPIESGCCVEHQFGVHIGVEGTGVEVDVPPACSTVAEGLTISNFSYVQYDDLGCCNALGGPYVTVVARP